MHCITNRAVSYTHLDVYKRQVLDMVKTINSKGLEVCATLGMVTEDQAKRLAEAGLYAYNHNIDTSEENYENIISTRKFDDLLNTINNVRNAGCTVCSGGIIGMGEKVEDRVGMLYTLSLLRPQPESVPINALVAVEGTPMEDQPPVPIWDMVRMIATARIISVSYTHLDVYKRQVKNRIKSYSIR